MKKLTLLATLMLTAAVFSTSAEAYRCAWNDGHRVCWHENTTVYHVYPGVESTRYVVYDRTVTPCYWVNGHRFCR